MIAVVVTFSCHCSLFTYFLLNRQKSLEDSLLVAGQFKDALQLLLDWLYKVEPSLNEDQPVHGDIDTVSNLIEQHKVACYLNCCYSVLGCSVYCSILCHLSLC